jgi:transcription termination/antitermination protein NusA
MDSSTLIESFSEFAKLKNIDRPTMIRILEDVFRTMIRKRFESDDNFDVIINVDKGDLEIWRYRTIVKDNADVYDPNDKDDDFEFDDNLHIKISDARKIEADFEVGEEVAEEVKFPEFGRRAVTTARQTLLQKVKDLEKDILFQKYKDIVGEIISAEVYQVLSREVLLVDDDGNELAIPKGEQIPKDRFRKGDNARAVVSRVEIVNGNPKIILSRTSPEFLTRLFEAEVPEVFDGLISIKKVVREPGERAKVAVESYDDRIDPVGACVGMKGSRIHSIVRELQNENIDVINYTDNKELLIARALSPAKITRVVVNAEAKTAAVYLQPDQVSLAIGKGGLNIKLASKLAEVQIDVYRDTVSIDEDDVSLDEFSDELDAWVIDELQRIGLDTAKTVLALNKEELLRRTDLEEETVEEILSILKSEFEEE